MKLLTTLSMLALAAGIQATAGNVTLYHGDTALEDGATVTITAEDSYGMVMWDFEVFAEAAEAVDATVTATCSPAATADSFLQFCWPTSCLILQDGNSISETGTLDAKKNEIQIHRSAMGDAANTEMTVTVTVATASETVSANFVCKALNAGIGSVASAGKYVNYNGRTLNYNLPANTKVSVYAITGIRVIEKAVNGQGSISLANLRPGVYLYRAGSLTGKFLVK